MDHGVAAAELQQLGFQPQFVGEGMESLVFDVQNSRLAKVWAVKTRAEVQQLQAFYFQLRQRQLSFATPLIQEVLATRSGFVVSIEERLPGLPLRNYLDGDPGNAALGEQGIGAVVAVVEALGRIEEVPAARDLNLLGEPSRWRAGSTWGTVIGDLVERRAQRHKRVLARSVADLDRKVANIVALLRSCPVTHIGVIHGDLCTENVLVEPATLTPTALLDFGFLTTSGDPLFDSVISALIYDMYSPQAAAVCRRLYEIYAAKYGSRFVDVFPLYKAAYALATSNAYSAEGHDGHFAWCATILNDAETNALMAQG